MAQDVLDRYISTHYQARNITAQFVAVPVLFHGHAVLQYHGTGRGALFKCVMNTLMNVSGVIVRIEWFTSSTTGVIALTAQFVRHSTSFSYLSGGGLGTALSTTAAPNGTANAPTYTDITFTNTQMGSIAAYESYGLLISRGIVSGDTLGADAYISTVSVRNKT